MASRVLRESIVFSRESLLAPDTLTKLIEAPVPEYEKPMAAA
jgi:hypothetical protein